MCVSECEHSYWKAEPLTEILARGGEQEKAMELGLTLLSALQAANVRRYRFAGFGAMFRITKGLKLAPLALLGQPRLSKQEFREFLRLLRLYSRRRITLPVLVHGDLHQSHILIDRAARTMGIVDLEAMHVGRAATNFAQLWIGYHYTDQMLGSRFYQRYCERFSRFVTPDFDEDVRFEVALRAFVHVRAGRNQHNGLLEQYADKLLRCMLSGTSFAQQQPIERE